MWGLVAYNCLLIGTFCSWNSSAMGLGHLSNQKFLSKAVFGVQSSHRHTGFLLREPSFLNAAHLWQTLGVTPDSSHTSFGDLTSSTQAVSSVHTGRVLEVQPFVPGGREVPGRIHTGSPEARDPTTQSKALASALPMLESWCEMFEPQWLAQLPIKFLGLYP